MPMGTNGGTSLGAKRDLRIDFFRGLALVFIFIDHVPGNDLARLTLRNFGFADAAEVFVLLAGFSAVLAYGRTFENEGFRAGTSRVLGRVRDIYLWHLGLVAVCALGLTLAAAVFANPMYVENIGVHVFAQAPARSTVLAATLVNQPNMLNILPLYIVLLLVWLPFVLWLLPRRPWQALVLSIGLWSLANLFELNLPSQQTNTGWVFNPFAWQLLVTIGAMTAHFSRRDFDPDVAHPGMVGGRLLGLRVSRRRTVDADPRARSGAHFSAGSLGSDEQELPFPLAVARRRRARVPGHDLTIAAKPMAFSRLGRGYCEMRPAFPRNLLPRDGALVRRVGGSC